MSRRPAADYAASALVDAGLREATLSGVRWTAVSRLTAGGLGFVSTVVLAHLVPPPEFGRAAVALVPVALAISLTHEAAGAALVRQRTIARTDLEAVALVSIAAGIALAGLTVVLGRMLVAPELTGRTGYLVELSAPAFVLCGAAVVPHALLRRALDFRRIGAIEVLSSSGGALAAVSLAIAGLDAEAIVLGALTMLALSALFASAVAPLVWPRWDKRAARGLLAFGGPSALGALVHAAYQNVDYALVAARLGAADAGFYWRAFQLAVDYQAKLGTIMARVAFPVYARTTDLEHMRRIRARIVRAHATFLFPVLTTLIAVAPELVPLVFGANWETAVRPTQILAVAGLTYVASTGTGPLLLAAGRPGLLLAVNVGALVSLSAVVLLAANYGLTAVCTGVAAFSLATVVIQFRLEAVVGVPMREILGSLMAPFAASACSLALTYPAAAGLTALGLPDVAVVIAGAFVAAASYSAVLRIAFHDAWSDATLLLRHLFEWGVPVPGATTRAR